MKKYAIGDLICTNQHEILEEFEPKITERANNGYRRIDRVVRLRCGLCGNKKWIANLYSVTTQDRKSCGCLRGRDKGGRFASKEM